MPDSKIPEKQTDDFQCLHKRISDLEAENAALKSCEQNLRDAIAYVAKVLGASLDSVLLTDEKGDITWVNRSLLDLMQCGKSDVLGKSTAEFFWYAPGVYTSTDGEQVEIDDSYRAAAGAVMQELLESGRIDHWETYVRRFDGVLVPVEFSLVLLTAEDETPVGSLALFRDMTGHKKVENALRESEQMHKIALEEANEWVWDWHADKDHVVYTPKVVEMLGYEPGEIEPTRDFWESHIHPDDLDAALKDKADHVAGKTDYFETEYRIRTKDGNWRWILDHGRIIERRPDGSVMRAVGTRVDITERKMLEEQLQVSHRMESIGTLAGGIAHDFNNLLTVIIGCLDILERNPDAPPAHRKKHVDKALATSRKAADLISRLQALSRDTTHAKESVDVYACIKDVFNVLEQTTDRLIEKQNTLKADQFHALVNKAQLNQVLLNLGTNAVQSIEQKGVTPGSYLRVSAGYHVIDKPDTKGLSAGRYVHIRFEDNGIGMSEEVRRKAFDPLFSTRNRGTEKGLGMGLANVYAIVRRDHNGYISLDSIEGEGTTVHIYLPASRHADAAPMGAEDDAGGKETILLVDDEEQILEVAREFLRHQGYSVLTAADGETALSVFSANRDRIDLVVLDLVMPRMSGLMVFEQMMNIQPDVPVIICSGQCEETAMEGMLESAGAFVKKPYRIHAFLQTIRTVLDHGVEKKA